jgi:hypothetical protein
LNIIPMSSFEFPAIIPLCKSKVNDRFMRLINF